MQYFTLHQSCQVPPLLSVQLIHFFPVLAVDLPTFAATVRQPQLIILAIIIRKENSSSSACGHSSIYKIYFLTLSPLSSICDPDLRVWPDRWVSAEFFFCASSLGKGWVAQTHCKLGTSPTCCSLECRRVFFFLERLRRSR